MMNLCNAAVYLANVGEGLYTASCKMELLLNTLICQFYALAFFNTAINSLKTVVTAIGAGLGVWGVINLLEGYSNDNPGAKSQGIKQLMAGGGIIIIAQMVIPQMTTLFSTGG